MQIWSAAKSSLSNRLSRLFSKISAPRRPNKRWIIATVLTTVVLLMTIAALNGEQRREDENRMYFANPAGISQTFSTMRNAFDPRGPFFKSMGTNGRSCSTCHQPSDGMSIAPASIQQRFRYTRGRDPLFRTVDGSNCNHNIDVSTREGMQAAYSLLLTRGLIRVAVAVPATADFSVVSVNNPYGCSETDVISQYRRPLPSTNLRFLSAVMFDGRESSPTTGTTKISFANYPSSLQSDLAHQSVSATVTHAEGDGTRPTAAEQQQIVDFEMSLYTAQIADFKAGRLDIQGGKGGPQALVNEPFFISANSSVHFLLPQFELPGGLNTPGDNLFTSAIFNLYDGWDNAPARSPRAAIARGQAIFASKPINITDVAGINDDVAAGGLVAGGIPALQGTCGTCHDTPNVGNHSFPTPLNIGTGDPTPSDPSINLGGLDISYLPSITVCKLDPSTNLPTSTCKTTTDLGQALIDGRFDHVAKIKGPILRGLASRAPYFHNGSAQSLLDAVHFYETRFGLVLTPQEESDLVAFLKTL